MATKNPKSTEQVDQVEQEEKVAPGANEASEESAATGTEVAVVNTGLAAFDFGGLDLQELGFSEEELKELTGLESIDSSEIRIPYATLIQKDSKEYSKGDILFADGTLIKGLKGEVVENIAILKVQPVRVYFPTPFNPNNTYICRSIDGKVGAEDGEYAGRLCASCEFAKYPEAGGASPCRDQRLLLCSREDGSLFHLQISGIGVGVWKQFMSAQLFHLLPKAKNILGMIKVKMAVKAEETNFGMFAAIDFRVDPKDPFHNPDRIRQNLNSLKSYKEFETDHAKSAANQARIQMAAGEAEQDAGNGVNKSLF